MRIAEVIGTVTLSRVHPDAGRRPLGDRRAVQPARRCARVRPDGEDLVIYDDLGAGIGSRIGFSEGGEAAAPFHPKKKPVDAYCACILDQVVVNG